MISIFFCFPSGISASLLCSPHFTCFVSTIKCLAVSFVTPLSESSLLSLFLARVNGGVFSGVRCLKLRSANSISAEYTPALGYKSSLQAVPINACSVREGVVRSSCWWL